MCEIVMIDVFFFFNDTATTEIYTLSLHDALPISPPAPRTRPVASGGLDPTPRARSRTAPVGIADRARASPRSEEHTSELQSRQYLVCRLLLEKKKTPETVQPVSRHRTFVLPTRRI